jgi:translation initiation factor IF-2
MGVRFVVEPAPLLNMPEEKTIRIAAASKEFNVGVQHIAEFLKGKGFDVDPKPTTKLTQDMYTALIKEYSKDKVLKEKADQVNIGVARQTEKVEEETAKPEPVKTEVVVEKVEAPVVVEKKVAAPKVEKVEEVAPVEEKVEIPVVKEEVKDVVEASQEKVPGIKILGKIDLTEKPKKGKEAPKKTSKKDAVKEVVEEKPVVVPEPIAEKTEVSEVKTEIPPVKEEEKTKADEREMIVTQRVKLEGPKIVGNIILPTPTEKKPVVRPESDADKKKRKRIRKPERISSDRPREDNRTTVNRPGGGDNRSKAPLDPEEQQRLIQEQIRTTLAKLGSGKGKSQKSKFRKQKREERQEEEEGRQTDTSILNVAEFTSLSELASLMNRHPAELVQKCFDLGTMVSINQRLDAEIIELLAEEFGFKVKFIDVLEDDEKEEEVAEDPELQVTRPPIVTIMGHVDHGKTSLLDYIRETNVVAGEKGGITQHIGAYEVKTAAGRRIAFLDTPGHEAFTAMRARGAKLTDLAIIVVAADDQVMPQTKEAISHAQAAGVPMVFAINKIDRPTANPEKIKEQLSAMNILVEDWGGKYQSQEISAKTGLNVDVLLEKVLLEADLLDLKANPDKEAVGTVIEASLDKGRGYVSNVMVQEGTLQVGDMVVAGPYFGRVKAMFNERNQKLKTAGPSTPLLLLGLNGAPQAGERFKIYQDEDEAKAVALRRMQIVREQGIRTKKHITLEEIGAGRRWVLSAN